jgi:hypothetical protein
MNSLKRQLPMVTLALKNLQERSYLKYWSRLTIVKIENDDKNYGKDLT